MTEKNEMDALLDDLFAEAKEAPEAQVSDDFMARMLAEAEAHQPKPADLAAAPPARGFWASLFDTLGGWQGTGGLVAATMASVFIGFSGAEALTLDGLQSVITGDTESYLSDFSGGFSLSTEAE
ncbi:hypothetical protein [Cognatishimia sp.]|uniref:hypothetical protein n=1 Tax=Cognatishimia sp. TaxID=2211648 RepID=UPI0035175C13